MTYRGHVRNGTVALDEPAVLPEGAEVEVSVRGPSLSDTDADTGPTWAERLASVIGKAENLPPDASVNHDHYLYGAPKR
ncbi:hypothetical protein FJY63_02325 [Candidatus Sumerlaeota bacterium]|nr:hypothetical protein [Candidatus Sumerlaeota bacterium]